nr:hypothetical protein [uncultured Allomuricauda sp.]
MNPVFKFNCPRGIAVMFVIIFSSCKADPNKQIDEGKIDKGIYRSEAVG